MDSLDRVAAALARPSHKFRLSLDDRLGVVFKRRKDSLCAFFDFEGERFPVAPNCLYDRLSSLPGAIENPEIMHFNFVDGMVRFLLRDPSRNLYKLVQCNVPTRCVDAQYVKNSCDRISRAAVENLSAFCAIVECFGGDFFPRIVDAGRSVSSELDDVSAQYAGNFLTRGYRRLVWYFSAGSELMDQLIGERDAIYDYYVAWSFVKSSASQLCHGLLSDSRYLDGNRLLADACSSAGRFYGEIAAVASKAVDESARLALRCEHVSRRFGVPIDIGKMRRARDYLLSVHVGKGSSFSIE